MRILKFHVFHLFRATEASDRRRSSNLLKLGAKVRGVK